MIQRQSIAGASPTPISRRCTRPSPHPQPHAGPGRHGRLAVPAGNTTAGHITAQGKALGQLPEALRAEPVLPFTESVPTARSYHAFPDRLLGLWWEYLV